MTSYLKPDYMEEEMKESLDKALFRNAVRKKLIDQMKGLDKDTARKMQVLWNKLAVKKEDKV